MTMAPSEKHRNPRFSDVIQTYFVHVVRNMYPEPDGHKPIETAIRNYIVNLQLENHKENEIYTKLDEMNPLLGDPLAFYEEFVLEYDECAASAKKAEEKAAKAAAKAAATAAAEFSNKRKCAELEEETRKKQATTSELTTARVTKKANSIEKFGAGCYVRVMPDLSPGKCSHGGTGFVMGVDGEGFQRTFTVQYDKSTSDGGKTECGIPYSRLEELPSPFEPTKRERNRKSPENFAAENVPLKAGPPPPTAIHEILSLGHTRNRGKGWRAKDLGVLEDGARTGRFQQLLREDAKELSGYLANAQNSHDKRLRSGAFKKRNAKFNSLSMKYLAHAWGVGINTPHNLLKKQLTPPKPKTSNPVHESVIDSLEAAKIHYSAKNLFIEDKVAERMKAEEVFAYDNGIAKQRRYVFHEEAKAAWVMATQEEIEFWEFKSRKYVARQTNIRDNILEAMRANPGKSFQQLMEDIDDWCSASTIHRWFSSHDGYSTYAQRTLPLLSSEQKKKHVEFCKHVRNNWGVPRQKTLWIHYDEKWFYGWVNRCNAKMCELLGLEKTHTYLYHKNHIEKVMAVAFTGYAFDSHVENGGHGLKLGLFRVQAARIAQKRQRESTRDEDGNIRYNGPILRMKGDAYLVDCNVTGSDEGTSDKPKFALKSLWEKTMFPKIEDLVGPGGPYEGYLVVIQGDNAGPHIDDEYIRYVSGYCEERGWLWEPQAPQMPHLNNLDLAVFPMMSKRHSALLKNYSNKMAPAGEIWRAAESVWSTMESAAIARGFILAYRISKKVIDCKGENTFLQTPNFHSGVRNDFRDTAEGVVKKIRVVE